VEHRADHGQVHARFAMQTTWPRKVVVEHQDGTVSLLSKTNLVDGTVRAHRAGDIFREDG